MCSLVLLLTISVQLYNWEQTSYSSAFSLCLSSLHSHALHLQSYRNYVKKISGNFKHSVRVDPSVLFEFLWIFSMDNKAQGNILCWELILSLTNLIRDTKISYLTAFFRRVLYDIYRNGPHRGTLNLSHFSHFQYLKNYEPCRWW